MGNGAGIRGQPPLRSGKAREDLRQQESRCSCALQPLARSPVGGLGKLPWRDLKSAFVGSIFMASSTVCAE